MIPDKVRKVLDCLGLKALEFEPGSTPTVEKAAERIGVEPSRIAKSLLFRSREGRYFMIVSPGSKKVSSSALKRITGSKLSMTGPEETESVTGFKPGGVCPFGLAGTGVEILIDSELGSYDTFYPSAGTDATGVPFNLALLAKATGGRVVDFNPEGSS